ncbi:MAG: DUF1800 domain-containing protein [Chloracidobacterium sp.]|nr:DUF1800 domain-containing protein [Chloracidobacterium sp.]MDW8218229.1 DUF1800 domain-containing protein [Acidobacteriota bacterium]
MLTRRRFLALSTVSTVAGLTGCRASHLRWLEPSPPPPAAASEAELRHAARLLNRFAYGATPAEVARVAAMGADTFLEEQLAPDTIPDWKAAWLVRRIEALQLDAPGVFDFTNAELIAELRRAAILRAVYSRRALYETMVEFWNDFFSIYAEKGDGGRLLLIHDRTAVRPYALGKFADLLRATATSPAMLVYLDGRANTRGNPNENYARELLELHTLGVDGGYTQQDVREASRALTGLRVREGFRRGQVFIAEDLHDDRPKTVLGVTLDGGRAEADLEALLARVTAHPATAENVARRLCRRFVADAPSAALVSAVAAQFLRSGGDIRATLQTLARSDELRLAPPKFKRPYSFAIASLRLLAADTDGGPALQKRLSALGQLPFDCPTPDGFPDDERRWRSGLPARWNFALALTQGGIRGTRVICGDVAPDETARMVWGRELSLEERRALDALPSEAERAALLLCAPDAQYG